MRKTLQPRPLVVLAAAGLLTSITLVGCGKSGSDGGDSTGGTSASGSGGSSSGSPNGGNSTGAGPTGGASGDAGATSGGSSGADATGGAAGEPGGESSGGTNGAMGGMSGTGSGTGGSAGSTAGAAGMTGTLGEPCSPRGALACAGNHQKLTVLCGGDDTWQPNQTCATDQFCDSTPGPNVGTCQPVAPGCEDGPGSEPWCADDDKNLISCGPDAVTTTSRACPRACHNGECRDDVDDCPVWGDYEDARACAGDCGQAGSAANPCTPAPSGSGCLQTFVDVFPTILRTPWADETCGTDCTQLGVLAYFDTGYVRVSASAPWSAVLCREPQQQCAVYSADPPSTAVVVSAPAGSGPANIVFEHFDTEPACPQ
jgi:hypothetical protein